MNETADVASNLPAIILLSFWWAFLSTLDLLSRPRESGTTKPPGLLATGGSVREAAEDRPFPEIRKLDPEFNAEAFLDGARRAYEAVLQAYALGDFETLRPLLSSEVLQTFAEVCAARAERQETLELAFIGIQAAEITSVEVSPDTIEISVLFRAQIVRSERTASGGLIQGDPAAVVLAGDLWTFSRFDGNEWVIVATDDAST
jgi:predicted lipid-binding transport protein (Tim44 family)